MTKNSDFDMEKSEKPENSDYYDHAPGTQTRIAVTRTVDLRISTPSATPRINYMMI